MIPVSEIIALISSLKLLAKGIAEISINSDGYSELEKDTILKAAQEGDTLFDSRVADARSRLDKQE